LTRLFQTEIPEIQEGIVLVKATAREAGERAKVAVASTKRDVDPIGACVGLRGTRIQVISRELRGEKIDIIEWSHDPATFVARALSPAKVSSVTINEGAEAESQPSAVVIVPDNQLSLAIGKKGQNARLAAKLTSMRIDIKSESEIETERAPADAAPAEDRAALASMGAGPELIEALLAAGLGSPAAIVKAGREKLVLIPEVGDRADALYADAEKLVAAQQASRAAGAGDDLGQPETPKETAETA
jgi:N utilization substance protein A